MRGLLNMLRPEVKREELPEQLPLTSIAKRHVRWWIARLADAEWKGSLIFPVNHQKPVVTFKSDASGDKMWGVLVRR